MAGKYIVVEGVCGSGKSALAEFIYDGMKGEKVLHCREPGGVIKSNNGLTDDVYLTCGVNDSDLLRYACENVCEKDIDPYTIYTAMKLSRVKFARGVLGPRLAEGYTCISDRSILSPMIYLPTIEHFIRRDCLEDTRFGRLCIPDVIINCVKSGDDSSSHHQNDDIFHVKELELLNSISALELADKYRDEMKWYRDAMIGVLGGYRDIKIIDYDFINSTEEQRIELLETLTS